MWAPAIVCVLATSVLIFAESRDDKRLRAISKPIAALAFIVSAYTVGGATNGLAGHVLLVGLILGALGDVLLIPEDNRTAFKAGIASFGLSHVAYVAVFAVLGLDLKGALVLLALGPFGWGVWTWLRETAGKLRTAVAGYIVIITVMVTAAVGCLLADPANPGRQVLLVAAVVFFLSDLCVARQRFVVKDPRNRYVGLPLYFGAQLLFGYGMSLA